jgi:hypothetical protein
MSMLGKHFLEDTEELGVLRERVRGWRELGCNSNGKIRVDWFGG